MTIWIAGAAVLVLGYLLGSLPTGYLAGRLVAGIDLREHGSGSTGATNVLRTLGIWPALAVFVIDVLKGVAAVLVAGLVWRWLGLVPAGASLSASLDGAAGWAACAAGLAALLGHACPPWLGFRGGKSVATGFGILLALSWPVALGAIAVFALALAATRFVSLGSMLAAGAALLLIGAIDHPLSVRLMVVAGGAYVILRHRANIGRLLAGTEPKLGRTAGAPDASR